MKQKLFYLAAMALISASATAQIVDVTTYEDCSKNGYTKGYAPVDSAAGRTYCEWVQLWEDGPKWATFNVGATITDYAQLIVGADPTSFINYTDQAPYYNTVNVGGLYAWNNPNHNGRKTTWTDTISTGLADVATTLWGSHWQTPSKQQLDSLNNDSTYTTWTWCDGSTTQYIAGCTLKGYKVSGKGEFEQYSIFLPAAGSYNYNSNGIVLTSSLGGYSSTMKYLSDYAFYLSIKFNEHFFDAYTSTHGRSVRAVLAE